MTGVVTTTDDAGSSGESTETPLDSDVSVSDDSSGSTALLVALGVIAYILSSGVIA